VDIVYSLHCNYGEIQGRLENFENCSYATRSDSGATYSVFCQQSSNNSVHLYNFSANPLMSNVPLDTV